MRSSDRLKIGKNEMIGFRRMPGDMSPCEATPVNRIAPRTSAAIIPVFFPGSKNSQNIVRCAQFGGAGTLRTTLPKLWTYVVVLRDVIGWTRPLFGWHQSVAFCNTQFNTCSFQQMPMDCSQIVFPLERCGPFCTRISPRAVCWRADGKAPAARKPVNARLFEVCTLPINS